MPRRRRVDLPGAVYHVTAQGNQQRRIFYTPGDYEFYLALLREVAWRFDLRVLAYALLPNHVHLVCRRGTVPLAKVMYFVQRRFALRHNRRFGVRGHVFRDRYQATLCDDERCLWALVRTVHDAPAQVGLCDRPEEYPWTSYHAYATGVWDLVHEEEARALLGLPHTARAMPATTSRPSCLLIPHRPRRSSSAHAAPDGQRPETPTPEPAQQATGELSLIRAPPRQTRSTASGVCGAG